MSEFQSNYPRAPKSSPGFVDVLTLQRVALSGLVWVIAHWLTAALAIIFSVVVRRSTTVEAIIGVLGLLWLGTAIGVAWCVGSWIFRAHQAVCLLRNIEPKMPSWIAATLSAVPFVLFGLPLSYTMEFIIIRAESADKPTMRWWSLWSKSGWMNLMAFLLALPSFGVLLLILPAIDRDIRAIASFIGIISLDFAMLLGAALVFQTNRMIANLARDRMTGNIRT